MDEGHSVSTEALQLIEKEFEDHYLAISSIIMNPTMVICTLTKAYNSELPGGITEDRKTCEAIPLEAFQEQNQN